MRPWRAVGLTAVFAGAMTLVVAVTPAVRFAYHAPALHVALETAEAMIAALAAFLLHGRFRVSGRADDLALVAALGLLAIANLGMAALPRVFLSGADARIALWAPLPIRVAGAMAVAAAALLPGHRLRRPQHAERVLVLLIIGGVIAVVTALVVARPQLPPIDLPPVALDTSRRPQPSQVPLTVAAQAVSLLCYATAAVRFAVRAERQRDELLTWIAAGCASAAFARVNYLLFPSLYTEWVYTGDVLRLGFYLLLLVGAAREIRAYWRDLAAQSVRDERRRIARNLHDGLAQELAFISTQSRRLSSSDNAAAWISAAADRALDESRRAIRLLTDHDEPLDAAVATTAVTLGRRMGVAVRSDVEADVVVTADAREHLLRILREAVTNAARHGQPQTIRVRLRRDNGVVLTVEDDGVGFDPSSSSRGFGLQTMRERADAVGGVLEIVSRPGGGTVVELRMPT